MLKTLKIEDLKGADYNPRTIAEPQLEQLCESIKKLGVIKPVILNGETNVLLAGHQRTRSMKKLGMTETPGFVLMGIKRHDEVRFNQYHNMVEVDVQGKAPEILLTNFEEIPLETHHVESWKSFKVINNGKMATMYLELSKMILRYGDFANAIIDHEGRVIVGAAYCMASLKLRRDIYVYRLNQEQSEFANRVFHLAFKYKEGSSIQVKRNGIIIKIKDAEEIIIQNLGVEKYSSLTQNGHKKEFRTCRNWQFAFQQTYNQ